MTKIISVGLINSISLTPAIFSDISPRSPRLMFTKYFHNNIYHNPCADVFGATWIGWNNGHANPEDRTGC